MTEYAAYLALDEYDKVSKDTFLQKHGYGEVKGLFVVLSWAKRDARQADGLAESWFASRMAAKAAD